MFITPRESLFITLKYLSHSPMAATEQLQTSPQDFFMDLNARLRSVEGRYNILRDRVLIINQNMIEEWKKNSAETRINNDEVKEIKLDLFRIKETLKHLISEFELYARKEDVKVLEKYINLWNPMKFMTEGDVKKLLALERNDGN